MGQAAPLISRRGAMLAGASLLAGCARAPEITGGFSGASPERGHLLRAARDWPAPAISRRTDVIVAGAGIAGLAAARALRRRGIEDLVVLELEDAPGGNSRAGTVNGIPCPLGAHYLPVPGDEAREVQGLLEELGLRRRVHGRWEYDERHLCHAPQERLFFNGQWQDGVLPLNGVGASTRAAYVRFAGEVVMARKLGAFRIPLRDRRALLGLDAQTFASWLAQRDLHDANLRWYLDYCCRDDYGAAVDTVSAWAGLHYFAARHGFHPPGSDDAGEREALLTWPEGNGFLARALATPLGDRFRGGRVVLRIAELRHGVEVDTWDVREQRVERWQASQCILALPGFIAARVIEQAPAAVISLARQTRHAPWVVANLHLRQAPWPRDGSPLAWDNVLHGGEGLGYVVATHQNLDPAPGPTVLTWYCAPGPDQRAAMLQRPWTEWRDRIVRELSVPHTDLPRHLTRIEVARYGHAMPVPVPGTLARLPAPPRTGRLRFAHGDWAGYSIFEEAFTLGHRAGSAA
jgi:predicted NAD/FAD-dependent oxidoreductase